MHIKILHKIVFTIIIFLVSIIIIDIGFLRVFPDVNFQMVEKTPNITFHENKFGHYWLLSEKHDRKNIGCQNPNARYQIALIGSSILYGSTTSDEDSFAPVLEKQLSEKGYDVCITNFSQPAGNYQTQRALVEEETQNFDVVVWEIWDNSVSRFQRFGNRLLNFGYREAANQIPDPLKFGDLNEPLLRYSNIYLYYYSKSLRPAPLSQKEVWSAFSETALPQMKEWSQRHNGKLLLFSFPYASQPFSEQIKNEERYYGEMEIMAREQSIPFFSLSRVLQEPRSELFADNCCHYNEKGTVEVSAFLTEKIITTLETN